jgi:hypothetical protein
MDEWYFFSVDFIFFYELVAKDKRSFRDGIVGVRNCCKKNFLISSAILL